MERMKTSVERSLGCRLAILSVLLAVVPAAFSATSVSWKRAPGLLACELDGKSLWEFSWATNQGKPFFHPLRLAGGESLTALKPSDHTWHYGLWFSWKYINKVNYWEEDKKTNKAEGPTRWDEPEIATHDNGSAEIKMKLRYISPTNGAVLMSEEREILVSAPRPDGGVTIDWSGKFTAGDLPLVLDRTPMPGEEHGAVNGGYAGFSMRAAQAPAEVQFVTLEGPVEHFETNRARPNSKAAACNVTQGGRTDGVAILSHASNTGGDSPWYMINSAAMRWFSPALLAPAPKKVAPHETFTWRFRVCTQAGAWTPAALRETMAAYK